MSTFSLQDPPPQITVFFLRTVKKILITAISENSSFLAKSLIARIMEAPATTVTTSHQISDKLHFEVIYHENKTNICGRHAKLQYVVEQQYTIASLLPMFLPRTPVLVSVLSKNMQLHKLTLTPSDFHFLNQNVLAGAILFFWNQYANIVRTKLSPTALTVRVIIKK